MKLHVCTLIFALIQVHHVIGHMEFSADSCLSAHNKLRALHMDTKDVVYDAELERSAKEAVDFLQFAENTVVDVRPTRPLPKRRRKRRHTDDDIDEERHIESWNGEIFYPESQAPKTGDYGESIHKICCSSRPHCPKEFFHGLLYPPSAEGVIDDFYSEEIKSYDFSSGKKKAQFYTQIKQFTNIVWKKTTKIGCAQSKSETNNKCYYTIVHYQTEGSIGSPDNYKANIGAIKAEESDSSKILMIFFIIFFIVLLISAIVLCYCCRDNLREKYLKVKIKTDTMKAEQELETDSTSMWWLRSFKKRKPTAGRPNRSRSTKHHQSLKEKPSIEVLPNSAPQRSIRIPPRVRGESNAQSFAIKYHGISKKAKSYIVPEDIYQNSQKPPHYDDDTNIYENTGFMNKPLPLSPTEDNNQHPFLGREPSLSGKPAPPPVPSNPAPVSRQNPMLPKNPVQQKPSLQKPSPSPKPLPNAAARVPSNASNKPAMPIKPLTPAAAAPRPQPQPRPTPVSRKAQTETEETQSSPSVNELRNQFNQQQSSPNNKRTPPVKAKPMLPPGARPR